MGTTPVSLSVPSELKVAAMRAADRITNDKPGWPKPQRWLPVMKTCRYGIAQSSLGEPLYSQLFVRIPGSPFWLGRDGELYGVAGVIRVKFYRPSGRRIRGLCDSDGDSIRRLIKRLDTLAV